MYRVSYKNIVILIVKFNRSISFIMLYNILLYLALNVKL